MKLVKWAMTSITFISVHRSPLSLSRVVASSHVLCHLKQVSISLSNSQRQSFPIAISVLSEIKCWGANERGQLGQGNTIQIADDWNEMGDNLDAIDLGSDFNLLSLHCGGWHICALSTDNGITCTFVSWSRLHTLLFAFYTIDTIRHQVLGQER